MAKGRAAAKKALVLADKATQQTKHFECIELRPPENPKGIFFKRPLGKSLKLSEEERQFLNEIEMAALRVSDVLQIPDNRSEVLKYLLAAAEMGLGGSDPDVETGRSYLEAFKVHAVRAAEKERREFILDVWKISKKSLFWSSVFIVVWLFLTHGGWAQDFVSLEIVKKSVGPEWIKVILSIIGISGFGMLGIVAGNLFVVFVRGRNLNFENFDQLSVYRYRPDMHLLYLSILTIVVFLLLQFKIVMIGVGTILLNNFSNNIPLAVVVGLVCSLSEAAIVGLVQDKTKPTAVASNAEKASK